MFARKRQSLEGTFSFSFKITLRAKIGVLKNRFFDHKPTSKHFSEYQKRFFGRSDPYKTCYLENQIFAIFDAKNTYFDVFFMFFDDFGRSQLFGSVIGGCRGAQEPKKIKIAKNGLKHAQTIIECHFKVFGVRTIAVGHHMSQFIFTDFWVFWGYFRGKLHYMSMLQRMSFFSKLGFRQTH